MLAQNEFSSNTLNLHTNLTFGQVYCYNRSNIFCLLLILAQSSDFQSWLCQKGGWKTAIQRFLRVKTNILLQKQSSTLLLKFCLSTWQWEKPKLSNVLFYDKFLAWISSFKTRKVGFF